MRRKRVSIAIAVVLLVVIAVWSRCRAPSSAKVGKQPAGAPVLTERSAVVASPKALPRWFVRSWAKPREIAGTVYRDGKLAPDTAVALQSSVSLASAAPDVTVRTDGSGHFSFGVVPPASYAVIASAPDRIAARVEVDLGNPALDPPPDRLELYLGRCEAVVTGFVRDASGGAVPGASLGTNRAGYGAAHTVQANEQGRYRLCVPRGANAISVSASGYGVVERVLVVVGTRRLDVALSPAATIEGMVVDASGKPVDQAGIRFQGRVDEVERVGNLVALSDTEGRFHLEVAPGAGTLFAVTEHGLSRSVPVEVKPGEIVRGLVLRVPPQAAITGEVRRNGSPAPAIELRFSSNQGYARTISEADGSFAVPEGPLGAVRVDSPTHRVISGASLTVPAGGIDHVILEVAPLSSIVGRVEHAGAPAVGARISLRRPGQGWTAISDLRGAFRIADLEAGTYELDIAGDGGREAAATQSVALSDGESKDIGTVELSLAGRIAGRVVDEDGQPVAEAAVQVEPGGANAGVALTDETGAFAVDALSLEPQRVTVHFGGAAVEALAGTPQIELTVLRPVVEGLTVSVRLRRARIAGRVIDPAGEPLPDVSLYARADGDARSWSFVGASAVTAADGRFRIDDLSPGRYSIRAAQRGGGDVVVSGIEAPRDGLEIALAIQGAIEGRLEQFSGPVEVVVTSAVERRARRAVVEGDRFHLRDLAAGEYLVMARGNSGVAMASVHVTPSEPARPVLRAEPPRRVTGVVRELRSKQPVAGMLCTAAPLTSPNAKLWYAEAPTTADGRFEITLGGEPVAIVCEGDANLTHAACAGAGPTVELWTIHKASGGGPSVGATFTGEPLAARVQRVEDGSRAQHMGLRANDLLVQVGDQDLDGIGAETAIELWLQQVERVELGVLRDRKLTTLRPLP